jgi:streptogramin lyase
VNYAGVGISAPGALAIDAEGDAWIANSTGSVVELASSGSPISPAGGFTGGGLANSFGIAFDASGNAWITNKFSANTNGSVTEFSSSGTPISGADGYTAGGIDYPLGIAGDSKGNMWIANFGHSTVTRMPEKSPTSASQLRGGGLGFPIGTAVDRKGSVWVGNQGNSSVTRLIPSKNGKTSFKNFSRGGFNGLLESRPTMRGTFGSRIITAAMSPN